MLENIFEQTHPSHFCLKVVCTKKLGGGGGRGEAYFGEFMVLFHRTSLCTAALSFSTQPVEIREGSSSFMENATEGNVVDKKYCFRMMVWLCAYYDFYDKKVIQCCS